MAYKSIDDPNFLSDLHTRKEFYELKFDDNYNFRNPGSFDPLEGKFLKLHSHQLFVRNFMNPNTPYKRLMLKHNTGTGKCFAEGTEILMYDGSVKPVESIMVGDMVMGDDSTPRTVESLSHGFDDMYKVSLPDGRTFVCNHDHILTLIDHYGEQHDIPLDEYLARPLPGRMFSAVTLFSSRETTQCPIIEPYLLGCLIANNFSPEFHLSDFAATTAQYIAERLQPWGVEVVDGVTKVVNAAIYASLSEFLSALQYNIDDVCVPRVYRCGSIEDRLSVLGGMVDVAGFHDDARNVYEILLDEGRAIADLQYICRSLCIDVDVKSESLAIAPFTQYHVTLSGGNHYCVRSLNYRSQEQLDETNESSFTVEKMGHGEYFGFAVDGNHRFKLGNFVTSHNSLSAIAIAQTYIEIYKKQYLMATLQTGQIGDKRRVYMEADKMTPSVYVFGFEPTKNAFYRELLKHPEFGFISPTEKEELIKLQKLSATSGIPADKKRYKDELHKIRKRITNKSKDGFYKFYGYQKFVNMLFLSNEVSLIDLEKMAIAKLRSAKPGETVPTLEDLVADYVKQGKIQINQQLLDQFRGSLIICDEFHNTYNMNMKNNYGVAIQYVLDYHADSINAIFLSATPTNNSPTEIVEVINYLVPPDQKVTKRELFLNNRDLKPGMLEKIGRLTQGRISFLQDFNPKYFPRRTFVGEIDTLPTSVQGVTEIPYLKFVKCPMSPLHQNTYIDLMNQQAKGDVIAPTPDEIKEQETEEEAETRTLEQNVNTGDELTADIEDVKETEAVEKKKRRRTRAKTEEAVVAMPEELDDYDAKLTRVPTNGYSIYDIVFPNPENDRLGLFRSAETRNKLMTATPEWRAKAKIDVKKFSSTNYLITGEFLHKSNIGTYSTKYFKMLEVIDEIYERSLPVKHQGKTNNEQDAYLQGEKIMIYHDRVKMSGVLLIQEILRQNNFIDEFSEPVDNTRCAFCTGNMGNHEAWVSKHGLIPHKYHPARFVMAHSDIDRGTMEASVAKFSLPDNANGSQYKILVGSKIIKEGYEMKDVQNLLVTMLPVNIPTLIQVFGRCVRKNSHINLPPEKREVKIHLFISLLDRGNMGGLPSDAISPEELRYVEKLNDYVIIQKIERELNRNAVDAAIHRDIIMPPELIHEYFPSMNVSDIKNTIYTTDKQPVDTIGNLYFNVDPPRDYNLRDLNVLTFTAYRYYDEESNTITYIIKRLFMQQPVWTYDDLWEAVRRPPFGVEINPKLFSEDNFVIALNKLVTGNILTNEDALESTVSKIFDPNDKYIYIGGDRFVVQQVGMYYIMFPVVNGVVVRDADSYLRVPSGETGVKIDMDKWIEEQKSEYNYLMRKQQFKQMYCGTLDVMKFLGDFDANFYNKLLEEIIVYYVDGKPKVDEQLKVLYQKVIELFDRFRIIVYLDEVLRYRDTAKKFTSGNVISVSKGGDEASKKIAAVIPTSTPIGFLTQKSVRLYDSPNWIEVSKSSMNKRTHFTENDIIVGYFDQGVDGKMKFKLRKPVQQLRKEMGKDTRMIERGIVCSTKSKDDLIDIAKRLGIDTKKMQRADFRIKTLCDIIKNKLLEMEMKHRQRDDKYKVFYLWNEQQPNLTGPPGVAESAL